jgi:hypothetical protein
MDSALRNRQSSGTGLNLGEMDDDTKLELLHALWPERGLTKTDVRDEQFNSLFSFVQLQFQSAAKYKDFHAAQTVDRIFTILSTLRSNPKATRLALLDRLQSDFLNCDGASILRSMELCLRIWLTLNVASPKIAIGPVQAPVSRIEWFDDMSLDQLVLTQFKPSKLGPRNRLDDSLTAANLVRSCDIHLMWTSNLADHLKFDRRTRVLKVYQHKICLFHHLGSAASPIPKSVIEEAIDTLNLLFPLGDTATETLLRREKKTFSNLGICGRQVQYKEYSYWSTHLEILADVLNEPPRTWKQVLVQQRSIIDSATFWNLCIAVLVLIFTVISIAFGTAQTIYAKKQYDITILLACASPDSRKVLSNFCQNS